MGTRRNKKPILYIYSQKGMARNYSSLHRRLHGRREIRVTVNDFGRVEHKLYEYPGLPHADVMPGVIAVESKEARRVDAIFREFGVPHIKIVPQKLKEVRLCKKSS